MGQKIAEYNSSGAIVAYYDSIDSPAPTGVANVIEITDEQWQTCISNPGWTVVNGALVAPEPPSAAQLLATAQASQIAILRQGCADAIASGFSSSALGSACTYPSTITDQSNQQTIAANANGGSLWCESNGSWSFKAHTQTQAQSVVASFATWLNHCQAQLVTLSGQVGAATSVQAVQAIAWTNPVIA